MEESMDIDMSLLRSQNYFFGCGLTADKTYHFKVDNDECEQQLEAETKDKLHIIKAEAMNYEGSPIKVTPATLKMSVLPTVFPGGFEMTPPASLRTLVAAEGDAGSEEEEQEDAN
ncbi:hypothetical protein U0070_000422 [Myodes glareolus]|uniref:Nucleophosmin n=1 Tax=Myodes glareolus TaxID=447135 RepID=A0AAW0HRG3_MYOGA